MNEVLKRVEDEYVLNYETIDYDYDIDTEKLEKYNLGTILPIYILMDESDTEIARSIGEKTKDNLEQFLLENEALNEK
jgi:hypothetical protein